VSQKTVQNFLSERRQISTNFDDVGDNFIICFTKCFSVRDFVLGVYVCYYHKFLTVSIAPILQVEFHSSIWGLTSSSDRAISFHFSL